jgi:hypothetical protein
LVLVFVLATHAFPVTAYAQALSSEELARERGEIVEMSPFVVTTERDTSWVASDTLIGNRTNEALANVPVAVDAITSEFIEDMAVYTMEDAAMFVSNLLITDQLQSEVAEGRVTYRGITKPPAAQRVANSSRNFFPSFIQTDNYNVERLDFNKGSNSLMFGDASPGGQTTSYTKRPRFRNFGKFYMQWATYGTYRSQFDLNYKLSNKVAVRINMVDRRQSTYIEFAETNLQAMHGAVVFQPFKNTVLRVDAEAGTYQMWRGSNTVSINTWTAPGIAFNVNNRWYYTSDGEIVHRTGSNPPDARDRLGPTGPDRSLMAGETVNIIKTERVGSTTAPTDEFYSFKGYAKNVNFLGTDDYQTRSFTNMTAWLEQKVGKLYAEAAFNQQIQYQDRNYSRFGTNILVDVNGRPYVQKNINTRHFANHIKIGRLSLSYPFEFGKWMSQFVMVNAERMENTITAFPQNLTNMAAVEKSPAAQYADEQIIVRAYLDNPDFPSPGFFERLQVGELPVTSDFRVGWFSQYQENSPWWEKLYQDTLSASATGSYLKGRLRTLVGMRKDFIKRKYQDIMLVDAHGGAQFPGTPDEAPWAYTYDDRFDLSNDSYMYGVTVKITEGINLYGVYSDSFHWQGAVDFTGDPIGCITGTTKEAGIKAHLFKKLHLTASVFDIERNNATHYFNAQDMSEENLEQLFNPNNLTPSDPGWFHLAQGSSDSQWRTVTSIQYSKGWELTLQMLRWHGFQARLTYSRLDVRTFQDMGKFRNLLDEAVARTEAALAPDGDPLMAENEAHLAIAKSILDNNDGWAARTGESSSPNSVNWLVDYEFPPSTFLKGTRVAVYGNWRDDFNVLYGGVYYRMGGTHPMGAYIMHRRKILGRNTTFRMGLSNLVDFLNSGDARAVGIRTITEDGTTYLAYRYIPSTTVDFSVTVDF